MKLHEDEFDIDAARVGELIRRRFPGLADLPLRRVESMGTVNALFRIGADLCVRLPRQPTGVKSLEREAWTLPRLAGQLRLRIPRLVEAIPADDAYPQPWLLCDWIPGEQYAPALLDDEVAAARDLAGFVAGLRALDPTGAPRAGRAPLARLDAVTRAAIEAPAGDFDVGALRTAWSLALDAPAWDGAPVWIHADLLRPNLLVRDGRLTAVLDFGSAGAGDPAADVIAAWSVFGAAGRAAYRAALTVDDATWQRARGYALHQALLIVPYYRHSNPGFAELAVRTITEILAEDGA